MTEKLKRGVPGGLSSGDALGTAVLGGTGVGAGWAHGHREGVATVPPSVLFQHPSPQGHCPSFPRRRATSQLISSCAV